MKLNEWLLPIVTQLFEKKEDADMFVAASAMKDIEVPDDVAAKFNQKFLTRERAFTDDEIVKKFNIDARGRVFDSVDLKIKKFIGKLSAEDQAAINAESNTLLKLELLDKALDNLGKNDDVKKINEQWRKREEEIHTKIKGLEDVVKEKETTFAKQVKDIQIDYALKNRVFGFQLASEFDTEEHKNFLAESTINSLRKNYLVELDEKDPSILHLRKNVDGQITEVFEGNTKVTLDDYLKKKYEPYIKKSTGGSGDTTPPKPTKVPVTPPSDKPVTLRDKIRDAAPAQ